MGVEAICPDWDEGSELGDGCGSGFWASMRRSCTRRCSRRTWRANGRRKQKTQARRRASHDLVPSPKAGQISGSFSWSRQIGERGGFSVSCGHDSVLVLLRAFQTYVHFRTQQTRCALGVNGPLCYGSDGRIAASRSGIVLSCDDEHGQVGWWEDTKLRKLQEKEKLICQLGPANMWSKREVRLGSVAPDVADADGQKRH